MGSKWEVSVFLYVLVFVVIEASIGAQAARRALLQPKPDPADAAATARWLVSQNFWGTLRHVVSFSDGLPNKGQGIPYFYLTNLDVTARNAMKDARSSFAVSEIALGSCGKADPQNPTCAKLTLSGKLKLVDKNSKEGEFAKAALFSKHPEMKGWPNDHDFLFFKLEIENLFLIDWFGGAKPLTVEQYLHPRK
ncbi:hypothetical protein Sjap_015968 [Stephania japonica]|uniref:CREG-like beta-barrel domain-containing protein n=1 Tax=Stephania japonica TaxID=461633 RepID=A0AAP0IK43_9MAGN